MSYQIVWMLWLASSLVRWFCFYQDRHWVDLVFAILYGGIALMYAFIADQEAGR